jgi:hypothetical protein
MSFVLERGGERLIIDIPDARTVQDLLDGDEAERVRSGGLVAEVDGTVLPLDGPIRDGARVVLRPPAPVRDHQAWLFRINSTGDRVRVGELMEIRAFQDSEDLDIWHWALSRIREEVTAWRMSRTANRPFFADASARHAATGQFGGATGGRRLFRLGRAAA